MGYVDVRDCSIAHLKAVQVEEAANQRCILSGQDAWASEIANILASKYNPQGFKVPTEIAEGSDNAGNPSNNIKSKEILGI